MFKSQQLLSCISCSLLFKDICNITRNYKSCDIEKYRSWKWRAEALDLFNNVLHKSFLVMSSDVGLQVRICSEYRSVRWERSTKQDIEHASSVHKEMSWHVNLVFKESIRFLQKYGMVRKVHSLNVIDTRAGSAQRLNFMESRYQPGSCCFR